MNGNRDLLFLFAPVVVAASMAVTDAAAGMRSCEGKLVEVVTDGLSSAERELAALIHQMNELKKQSTTPASVVQIAELNKRALVLIADELTKLNIAYRLVDPTTDLKNPLSRPSQKKTYETLIEKLEGMRNSYEKNWREDRSQDRKKWLTKMITSLEGQIRDLRDRVSALDKPPEPPSDFKYASLTDNPLLGALHLLSLPHIVVEESEGNPPLINDIIRAYKVDLILSPNFKSLSPDTLAAVSDEINPRFYYPIEEIFGSTFGLNGTLLHELTHLRHARMEVQGIALPYFVRLKAKMGEKLHLERDHFYDEFMSFDELSAWNKDLNYTGSIALGSLGKRSFQDGHVYRQDSTDAVRHRIAKGLDILCRSGATALAALRDQLIRAPESAVFRVERVESGKPSSVSVPYLRDGRVIGSVQVTLVKLHKSNEQDKMRILLEYLDQVEARLNLHSEKAKQALASFPNGMTESPWVKIGEDTPLSQSSPD